MELFHNQVTREQGIFSYRFNHASHGLYMLAENLETPTTVLDFPTLSRFKKEIKKGYDYIGISFIVPNFEKTVKMANIIREIAPKTKIILGGHGVNIPNIEDLIPHDYICKGEGIAFLRKLFNENVNAPIKHSCTYSSYNRQVMGAPWASDSGVIITGVGCANKCRFCATSHFFGEYSAFLKTGQEIFDVCLQYEKRLNVTDFGILDENFLKTKNRALELLEVMERENHFFTFSIFSSAETLNSLDNLDILVRLGVKFIWIGVESKREIFAKNKDINLHQLIQSLQQRGISVMASAILFLEYHDQKNIWEDINFVSSMAPDYLQYMQLGPMPGTALYEDYQKQGKLLDVPKKTQHGQKQIWFKHPNFTRIESEQYLKKAFRFDYQKNGASLTRTIKTYLKGFEYISGHSDPRVKNRAKDFKAVLKLMRLFVFSATLFSENEKTSQDLKFIKNEFNRLLGRGGIKTALISLAVLGFAIKESLRLKFIGDYRRPATIYTPHKEILKKRKKNLKINPLIIRKYGQATSK